MTVTAKLTEDIIAALSTRGCLVSRNNTGLATYTRDGRTYTVAYGVGPRGGGGGDLIGCCPDGIFLSIEIKVDRDKQTDAQKKWERWVLMRGGRAGVARSVEDALRIAGF